MNSLTKKIIAITLSLFIAYLIYYGSFLPFRKAQKYIKTRETQVNSLDQFNALYDGLLNYPSPAGQDEIVSAYLEILSILIDREASNKNFNEQLVRHLVGKAEEWAGPIIEKGAGFSFSKIIFNFANVYRSATIVLQDEEYYKKAIRFYALGLEYSPDRTIFLYNLFDMYRFGGDKENARKIGERIMKVYKDEKVGQILQDL